MLNLFFVVAVAFGATQAVEPRLSGNLDAARGIVKAETDFAALAATGGTAKAFRDFMDPVDGVIYEGHTGWTHL